MDGWDHCAIRSGLLEDLQRYNKILEQRNALLKQNYEIGIFQREPLEIWDEQLTRYGKAIHAKRSEFIQVFVPLFQRYYQWISEEREQVELAYESLLHSADLLICCNKHFRATHGYNIRQLVLIKMMSFF